MLVSFFAEAEVARVEARADLNGGFGENEEILLRMLTFELLSLRLLKVFL